MLVKKTISIIVISACLYWLRNLILENSEMQSVTQLLTTMTLPVIIISVVILVGIQAFLSYKVPALTEEQIKGKIREYVFSKFTPEQMSIVGAMSEEDKWRFLEEMLKLQTPEVKAEMDYQMAKYQFSSEHANLRLPKKLLKLSLVSLVLFLSLYVYQTVGPEYRMWLDAENTRKNEVIIDQILYIDGLPPIQLRSDNTFKKIKIEKIMETFIKVQPTFLLENANMIVISNHENQEKIWNERGASDYKNFGVRAFASPGEMTIYVEDHDDISTYRHELSHLFDYAHGNRYGVTALRYSPEFTSLYDAYKNTLYFDNRFDNSYSRDDIGEFFAVGATYYFEHGEQLKNECEPLYNYFKSIFCNKNV